MNIFLHRMDLRLHDNKGLFMAAQDEEVVPLYVKDVRRREWNGRRKNKFIDQNLERLQAKYRERGSDLLVKKGKTEKVVEDVLKRYNSREVFFNRHYTPLERKITSKISKTDAELHSYRDRLLVEPNQLSTEYDTFSPFYREWKNHKKDGAFPEPSEKRLSDEVEAARIEESKVDFNNFIEAGESAALEKWKDFRDNRLTYYKDKRDDVSKPKSVSRLSVYYSSGVLGLRKVLEDIEELIENSDDSDDIRNFAKYKNELAWREFFYQVIWHNPACVANNYREFENDVRWRNDSQEFEAWKNGQTGVPFVDAGMRQLNQTGYMHNRLRQNVASFLTKHLMIDWRMGADYFREKLVDHDTASNNGGWQWAASTGTDSVSIRIFNPVKQGRKYDPDAEYIKKWVPELRGLDPNTIHSWVEMSQKERNEYDTEYPDPIINFNQRYHMGKKMFENALGK